MAMGAEAMTPMQSLNAHQQLFAIKQATMTLIQSTQNVSISPSTLIDVIREMDLPKTPATLMHCAKLSLQVFIINNKKHKMTLQTSSTVDLIIIIKIFKKLICVTTNTILIVSAPTIRRSTAILFASYAAFG
jgi:hypothetical protein